MKRTLPVVGLLAVAGLIVALYRPAFDLELTGDDYQWLQHAHAAMHRPALLLADLDSFYRPLSTWTLVADRALWGRDPGGYHLTNVLLHALAAALLVLAARRLAQPWPVALAVGLLWGTSPFATEPALSVAIRFESLLLLAWLGLVLAWPRRNQAWTAGRVAAVAVLAATALVAKESWVVTPVLVFLLDRAVHGASPRQALRTAAPFAAAAAAYTVIYFLAFPGGKNYYHLGAAALAKVPHQLAAFLWLEQLRPIDIRLTAAGVVATLVTVAVLLIGIRRRDAATSIGAGLLLLPMLPTLFVPYLPTRYTVIPFAGFLLVAAAAATNAIGSLRGVMRRLAGVAAATLAVTVLAAGVLTVRADLADFSRVSDAHRRLLSQVRAVVDTVGSGAVVAVVRGERSDPLRDIALSVHGLPKLFFPRPDDPDGLVDAAALFEWVLAREGRRCAGSIPTRHLPPPAWSSSMVRAASRLPSALPISRPQRLRGAVGASASG